MKHIPTYELDCSYFNNVVEGTEFFGKFRGIGATKNYWIGVCQLNDIKKQSEFGEIQYAIVKFIICKKTENSLSGLFNLKQKVKEKKLKLTFKGISSSGFPIFFHEFI